MSAPTQAAGAPRLSVVVAAHNPGPVLADCLAALCAEGRTYDAEIIVADSSSDGTMERIRQFPEVRVLHFTEPLSVPRLRGLGIASATGDVVAIVDPFCIVRPGWMAALRRLHAYRREPAIGGAVELDGVARRSLLGWATYLCEYGAFVPPLRSGPAGELTGNNISYKREALPEPDELRAAGFWKTIVNHRLRRDGRGLWTAPELLVALHKPIPFPRFLRSRYDHGRCFAGMRAGYEPPGMRWWRAATSPALPVLALWRRVRSVWPKPAWRRRLVAAIPLLLLCDAVWAWGELWGYLRGPGRSCARIVF